MSCRRCFRWLAAPRRPGRSTRIPVTRGRRAAYVSMGLMLLLAGAGCGGSGNSSSSNGSGTTQASFYTGWPTGGTPVRGGSMTIVAPEAPTTFVPYAAGTEEQAVSQVYDELFELMPGKTASSQPEVKPALASSWSVSPNQLNYVFHIRPGVKFSNGEPLTGEDVVYSLDRQKLPIASIGAVLGARNGRCLACRSDDGETPAAEADALAGRGHGADDDSIVPKKVSKKRAKRRSRRIRSARAPLRSRARLRRSRR